MEENTIIYVQGYQSLKWTNPGSNSGYLGLKKNKQQLKGYFHFPPCFLKSLQGTTFLKRF